MTGLRYLAGALALCIALSTPVMAKGENCATREALMAFVGARLRQAEVTVLQKFEARLFLAAVKRIVPAAALAADEIVIIDSAPEAPAVHVALFEAGCMTRVGHLPRPVLRAILNFIARSGA